MCRFNQQSENKLKKARQYTYAKMARCAEMCVPASLEYERPIIMDF